MMGKIISLFIFLAIFCIILFRVMRPSAKKTYEGYANIPLEGEENEERKR